MSAAREAYLHPTHDVQSQLACMIDEGHVVRVAGDQMWQVREEVTRPTRTGCVWREGAVRRCHGDPGFRGGADWLPLHEESTWVPVPRVQRSIISARGLRGLRDFSSGHAAPSV